MATRDERNLFAHIQMPTSIQMEEKEEVDVEERLLDMNENKYEEQDHVFLETGGKGKRTKTMLGRQETLNTQLRRDELMMNEELQLPYKKKCHSITFYWIKSLIVTHPRLYSLFLLYRSIWPRLLGMSVVHILYFVYDINCCYV